MKHVTVITPGFFHLDREIVSALEKMGYGVKHIVERPNSNIAKALIRLNVPVLSGLLKQKLFGRIKKQIPKDTLIISFNPEVLGTKEFEELSTSNSDIRVYLWDSTRTKSNFKEIIKQSPGKIFTFDLKDSINYSIDYLPLFYPDLEFKEQKKDIDVCFIGTLYGSRLKELSSFFKLLSDQNLNFYVHAYCKSLPHYWFYKLLSFVGGTEISVTNSRLNREELYSVFARSKATLDIAEPDQWGMSFRTLEAMRLNCKIISNNNAAIHHFKNKHFFISAAEASQENCVREFVQSVQPIEIDTDYSVTNFLKNFLH